MARNKMEGDNVRRRIIADPDVVAIFWQIFVFNINFYLQLTTDR